MLTQGIRKTHHEFLYAPYMNMSGTRAIHGWSAFGAASDSDDCFGHGTHTAATAGGLTHGVAKNATMYAGLHPQSTPALPLPCPCPALALPLPCACLAFVLPLRWHAPPRPALSNASLPSCIPYVQPSGLQPLPYIHPSSFWASPDCEQPNRPCITCPGPHQHSQLNLATPH